MEPVRIQYCELGTVYCNSFRLLFLWYNSRNYWGRGLFQYGSPNASPLGTCTSYKEFDDITLETLHVAAGAGGIIAVVALFLGFAGLCLTTFVLENRAAKIVWLISKILYCLALVGTGMTFAMFSDELCGGNCELAATGYLPIANAAFLIAMVSYCWCVPIPKKPCCRGGSCCDGDEAHFGVKPHGAAALHDYTYSRDSSMSGHQAVPVAVLPVNRTITVKNTPTGKTITEEVLNSDGSKTVTITHEEEDA